MRLTFHATRRSVQFWENRTDLHVFALIYRPGHRTLHTTYMEDTSLSRTQLQIVIIWWWTCSNAGVKRQSRERQAEGAGWRREEDKHRAPGRWRWTNWRGASSSSSPACRQWTGQLVSFFMFLPYEYCVDSIPWKPVFWKLAWILIFFSFWIVKLLRSWSGFIGNYFVRICLGASPNLE